jgi:hypothetical protein
MTLYRFLLQQFRVLGHRPLSITDRMQTRCIRKWIEPKYLRRPSLAHALADWRIPAKDYIPAILHSYTYQALYC